MTPLLEMRRITKEYRGVPAVKDVDFTLMRDEIHALLGENGAGKSTLTKIIAGAVQPTHGELLMDGKPIAFPTPAAALEAGVAMVYQENSLVPALTVAQNIYLGRERFFNRMRGINIAAQQFLQSLNFPVDPTATVATLGAAKRQMVEIARAVHQKARIIIFDEPTASLTPEEKHHFFSLIRRLKKAGVAIVFISHALEEALLLADRITILRDGQHVVTDATSEFDRDKIIRAMVGRTLSGELYSRHGGGRAVRPRGEKVLSVQNLSMGALVRNTSFSIFAGQITGIFGLIGSGRTETAKIVAGVVKRDFFHGGEVVLEGHKRRYRVPRPGVRDGVVYVTEDRKLEGFFETMSIAENIYMGLMASKLHRASVVSLAAMRQAADEWTSALQVRAINRDARVIELSGGNQQKVVIAKSLVQKPRLVIFDEPTRGVDV
ncbi:sugar ABC transporter ATP-binding protein, partial [Acidisphaera rubrifaciens]|uniref:sugar ABC transporter ATP-binding protein n=1 Tax=Acidisphaera rubrifaciens TaxID=50715 RepID=UPI0006621AF1